MYFLIPETNKHLLRMYHTSSKCIIPFLGVSYLSHINEMSLQYPMNAITIMNFGYHSYVSTSCVITDYVKFPKIERITRISNITLHMLASVALIHKSSQSYFNVKQ